MSQAYQHPVTAAGALRLHLNENTAGCSPKVLDALRALGRDDIALYPDYDAVYRETAHTLGVPESSLLLTNGLDEGILLAAVIGQKRRPADGDAESIVVLPAFDMYAISVEAVGGRVVFVSPRADFTFPLEGTLAAITPRTRTVYITSPNNPTGVRVSNDAIRAVARALPPDALVFVDEAYHDFCGDTVAHELGSLPHVVVGRTFAKAQGLAALRAGAIIAVPETLDAFKPVIPPYSLNVAAAAALRAALADRDYIAWYVDQVRQSRERFYEFCRAHGFEYWESSANFVLARVGDHATPLTDALRSKGIYIRDKSTDPTCRGCIRMTTGTVEATEAAVAAMEEYLVRRAVIDRKTNETQIQLKLTIEGRGRYAVSTGIRFLDHMLELFTRHGAFDLDVKAIGDLDVDQHHTVEDLGIALGEAVSQALGDRRGINRAGYFVMPMDETLAVVALDLGGRPHATVDLKVKVRYVGDLQAELVHDFFEGFATGARANVHAKVLYGRSSHHHIEAVFKAFARALRVACSKDKQLAKALPSTKGLI